MKLNRKILSGGFALVLVALIISGYSSASAFSYARCLYCSSCVLDGEDGHRTFPGDQNADNEINAGIHGCFTTGTCLQHHPPGCSGSEEEQLLANLEDVEMAIAAGDLKAAKRITRKGGNRFAYVSERDAVQFIGCNRTVIAHFPLDR